MKKKYCYTYTINENNTYKKILFPVNYKFQSTAVQIDHFTLDMTSSSFD